MWRKWRSFGVDTCDNCKTIIIFTTNSNLQKYPIAKVAKYKSVDFCDQLGAAPAEALEAVKRLSGCRQLQGLSCLVPRPTSRFRWGPCLSRFAEQELFLIQQRHMFAIQNFFFIGPKSDHCIGYPCQLLTHQLTNALKIEPYLPQPI